MKLHTVFLMFLPVFEDHEAIFELYFKHKPGQSRKMSLIYILVSYSVKRVSFNK